MTVIRPNSISGITSITAQGDTISLFRSDGTTVGALNLNVNASSGVSTFANLVATGNVSIAGTLTYEDVTNVDSIGIVTARTGIQVLAGGINAVGVVTATSFSGDVSTNAIVNSGITTTATLVVTSDVTLRNQSDLRFGEDTANGTNFVAFQAPASVAADVTWTLPSSDAAVSGYALVSDAAGALSWAAAGGGATGGGSDKVFFENDQTITTNYTLTTNKNAMTAGPVTINPSIVVTIPSGASWVVV